MKNRAFLNWLIILIGMVAMTSFCFTSAFADEVTNPSGAQVQSGGDSASIQPLDDPELLDDSFGRGYQWTWIPFSSFIPGSSNVEWSRMNGYLWVTGGVDNIFISGIRLPSGAYLNDARVYYYDNSSGDVTAYIYRNSPYSTQTLLDSCNSTGTPGYSNCTMFLNETIRNGDSYYTVYVHLGAATSLLRFAGVRLYWNRQIRTGLSTPFNDIGGLSQDFRDSIGALYASGITTGTSPNTYSPNNPVTRAQMAAFLARALGLHWGYPY